jgi:Flp pilus assembly protein TadG
MIPNCLRKRGERGVSLVLGICALVFIVPMMGLGIDVGFLYSAKDKLQASVDGAALAAARALTLGASTTAQATSAKQNAVNWFYANFPAHVWATVNTQMDTTDTHVHVYDDATNTSLRHVDVSASTDVPTWFMRWFGYNTITITAIGNASRRDVVAMIIIDRSGSMNSNNGCSNMRAAAKVFTGQFAAGRDQIGMVEFGDTSWVDSSPATNFRTVLGYTANGVSGSGLIDTISCGDNTGTAQAISLGYNELYKVGLPGAFNFLMFFTDGIPNSVTVNLQNVMLSTSGCQDSAGRSLGSGSPRGNFVTNPPSWTPGWTMPAGYYSPNIPAGPIGVIASDDPPSSGSYGVRKYKGVNQGNSNHGTISIANAPGCSFPGSESNYVNDFRHLPTTDVWGNALVNNAYNPLTTDGTGIVLNGTADNGTPLSGNNLTFHLAARNAADSAANQARTNATIPATVFGIGLGGTSVAPPGYDFMQRITNDPNGDLYNSPPLYPACNTEPLCTSSTSQPQGVFIFSSDPTKLQQAFLAMASQILRLAK